MSGLSLERLVSNLKSVALTVFELLAFNSHDRPLRTHKHTNRHTSNERIISAIHFVHLAEITSWSQCSVLLPKGFRVYKLSYKTRLKGLGLERLEIRRLHADLTMCFKIVHNLVNIRFDQFLLLARYVPNVAERSV